jgi:hypothetical protein
MSRIRDLWTGTPVVDERGAFCQTGVDNVALRRSPEQQRLDQFGGALGGVSLPGHIECRRSRKPLRGFL